MMVNGTVPAPKVSDKIWRWLKREWRLRKYLYLMSLPVLAYFLVFHYYPMYGVQIAFKQFKPRKGIWGSPWVGFKHFETFFDSFYFERILRNTIVLSALNFLVCFPAPIILALLMNEIRHDGYKRVVQTVTYMPYFISLVVVCGLLKDFVEKDGVISAVVQFFGGTDANLLTIKSAYRPLYIGSNIWQSIGFDSIIYMAAIAGVDQELYEAGAIDGITNRFQRVRYITFPSIVPTITIMFILSIGSLMNVGYEKTLLLYNDQILEVSDIISTFVYRKGLLEADYSYSAAIGLFNSVINCALLVTANTISSKVSENSLW